MVLATFPYESSARPHPSIPAFGLAEHAPTLALTEAWDGLVEGSLRIASHRVDEAHAWLVLAARPTRARYPALAFKAGILAGALTGGAQKVMALDHQRMPSTVSSWMSGALRHMGVDCSVRHAPLGLALLASVRALGHGGSFPGYRVVPSSAQSSFELRMPRPDPALRDRLAPSEYDVVREVIAGSSYKEIGTLRDRSPRTVANQLRNVGIKLGVTGRFEWIRLAVALSAGLR